MLPQNKMVRKSIESMYKDRCTVKEKKPVKKPNGATVHEEVEVFWNEPCRLSFGRISIVGETDLSAHYVQNVKLFIAPELDIKAGSKIVIKHELGTDEYSQSGEPAIYSTHQEIMLVPFKGYV